MGKIIITVGCEIPGFSPYNTPFKSKISLLDFDIIIFNPDIQEFKKYCTSYRGKDCLRDDNSFQLKEQSSHWYREILSVIKSGRNVFILLNEFDEIYIATGEQSHSGTGKNRVTTRMVDLTDNYRCIPFRMEIINSKGKEFKLNSKENLLKSYWSSMSKISEYQVRIDGEGLRVQLGLGGARWFDINSRPSHIIIMDVCLPLF